mmetsp:Transcript_6115/g.20228  ORF Transcript_6115/g.20228 Transcript_6115/m.20228 type:complete len:370 (-) Transcript_6115:99-1208(-)
MKSVVAAALLAGSAVALTPAGRSGSVVGRSAAMSADYGDFDQGVKSVAATPARGGAVSMFMGLDFALLGYFFFWYLGNYYYNITNKLALKGSGGSKGFPMTIASLQLGVGVVYALFAWVAPDMRSIPALTMDDIVAMLPVAFCSMMAHCASVFALSAGAVSFGQIVKAAEPAFAAVLSQFVYGKPISQAKWLCLIPVIGGVIIASVKELDFAVSALVAASIANVFAAFKGNENKKLMETPGLKDRLGSVGNQFALTTILSFLMSIPLVMVTGESFAGFSELWKTNPVVRLNVIASGLFFYGYNELATMTIKKTNAITQSVANTAKRVIIIIGVALVLGEDLPFVKLLGSAICIGGVFLYSVIDSLLAKM